MERVDKGCPASLVSRDEMLRTERCCEERDALWSLSNWRRAVCELRCLTFVRGQVSVVLNDDEVPHRLGRNGLDPRVVARTEVPSYVAHRSGRCQGRACHSAVARHLIDRMVVGEGLEARPLEVLCCRRGRSFLGKLRLGANASSCVTTLYIVWFVVHIALLCV